MKIKIGIILITVLFLSAGQIIQAENKTAEVKRVEGNKIIFKDGSSFETTLYHLKYFGRIRSVKGKTYLILSGKSCDECDANISIYVHSPQDGPMKGEEAQVRYTHPGKEYDVRAYIEQGKKVLAYEARAFWGRCMPGRGDMVIWHEKLWMEDRSFRKDVFILEPGEKGLKETFISGPGWPKARKLPSISQTLKMVSGGECREIPGISRMSEP